MAAGGEEKQAGVRIKERNINNLRYTDDTSLRAENKENVVELIKRGKISNENADS
jgi:hypothetical protein